MEEVYCLIILESGIRRKLKLQSGTYDELIAGLAGMVEVDSKNTLVQMFDTDLDDLVDLLPGDVVPNKAKIHVFQRTALALRYPSGDAMPCGSPAQSTLKIVSTSSLAIPKLVKQENLEPSVLPPSLATSVDTSVGEASQDVPDAGDQTTSNDFTEALEQMTSQNDRWSFGSPLSSSATLKIWDTVGSGSSSSTLRDEEDGEQDITQHELVGEPERIQDEETATSIELRIIHLLSEVRQRQRDCLHQLQQLRHSLWQILEKPGAEVAPSLGAQSLGLPALPARTIDELEAVEAAVGDCNVAAALQNHLVCLGGGSLAQVGSNMMSAVMGVTVQQQFSLHGKKGKRPFINMRLCSVVTDAICEKQGVDLSVALGFIRRWLPGSVDRAGGRKRRYTESF